tara:strand:- start:187 stop:873 length:687 start_codon:yes stop_codon:yes gene_type:complete
MNCSSIDIIFPAQTIGSIESASSVILNAIPSLVTVSVIAIFIVLRQPSKPLLAKSLIAFLNIVFISVITFLLWRVFDVLECKNRLEMIPYKYLVIILFPIVSLIISFSSFFRNTYRLSSLLFLIISSGFVAVDFSLRKFSDRDAAQTVFASQTFTCCLALLSLFSGRYFALCTIQQTSIQKSNKNCTHPEKRVGEGYCYQPNFIDPTSRHPIEARGVGSAPEFRSVFA